MKITRILVPVDFSPNSLNALEYAVDFSKPFKARIAVLFVVEPIYYAVPDFAGGVAASQTTLLEEQIRIGRQQLHELERRYAKRRVKLETLLQAGTAFAEIVDMAKRNRSDVIIMATHGRTGLSHILLGSVAERVVRSAPCAVLTIRGLPQRRAAKRARAQ